MDDSFSCVAPACGVNQFLPLIHLSIFCFVLQLGHCTGCCTLCSVHPAGIGQPSPARPRDVFDAPVRRLHELIGDFVAPSAVRTKFEGVEMGTIRSRQKRVVGEMAVTPTRLQKHWACAKFTSRTRSTSAPDAARHLPQTQDAVERAITLSKR